MRARYSGLQQSFPAVHPIQPVPYACLPEELPFQNQLEKPEGVIRLLILMPWLIVGGAERVNLELIQALTGSGRYEVSIATTIHAVHNWAAEFARYTQDIFLLDRLLH